MTTALQLLIKVGIMFYYTLHRGGSGADLEVNYLPKSSTTVRVLSLWLLESLELVQSWGESEALAEEMKVWCLFFDRGLVLVFKPG